MSTEIAGLIYSSTSVSEDKPRLLCIIYDNRLSRFINFITIMRDLTITVQHCRGPVASLSGDKLPYMYVNISARVRICRRTCAIEAQSWMKSSDACGN